MPGQYLNDRDKDRGSYDEDREAEREFDEDGEEIEPQMCEHCGRIGGCPCDDY